MKRSAGATKRTVASTSKCSAVASNPKGVTFCDVFLGSSQSGNLFLGCLRPFLANEFDRDGILAYLALAAVHRRFQLFLRHDVEFWDAVVVGWQYIYQVKPEMYPNSLALAATIWNERRCGCCLIAPWYIWCAGKSHFHLCDDCYVQQGGKRSHIWCGAKINKRKSCFSWHARLYSCVLSFRDISNPHRISAYKHAHVCRSVSF